MQMIPIERKIEWMETTIQEYKEMLLELQQQIAEGEQIIAQLKKQLQEITKP